MAVKKEIESSFETFMENRNIKDTQQLMDYVGYLEEVKSDYEVLRSKVASLHSTMEKMMIH